MKLKYLIIAMMFIVSLGLSGCGSASDETLESYMDKNKEAKDQVEQMVESVGDEEMESELRFEGNTIIVTETLGTTYSERIQKKMAKKFSEMPDDTFSEAIANLEEASMIDGITMRLVLLNGDGNIIMDKQYRSSGK